MIPGKIVFISKGNEKPSTRYRARQFDNLFTQDGWDVGYINASGSLLNKIKALKQAYSAEVIVVIRKNFSLFHFKILRLISNKLIYDFDDANFIKPDGSESHTRYASFKRFMLNSDHIWAGNNYLALEAKKFTPKVSIVPTSIKPEKYAIEAQKPENTFDLVWIGSQSTSRYIKEIIPVLEKASEQLPNLRLKIIADFKATSDKFEIISLPWSSSIEAYELASSHVGLAPMPDTPWSRGKCGLKVLQYMTAGLPVISSNSGVNAEIIEDGITGYLVDSDEQWIDALEKLYKNRSQLNNMGINARKEVNQHYSINAVYQIISGDLKKLCLTNTVSDSICKH
ncbi:MAG: hypothetical protein DRQ43_10135 [Gammaproteobacteria bacterium]|nr:MAG: hypothetical protein DRQ43_10135 [Gammaproteobacteria bacterium]